MDNNPIPIVDIITKTFFNKLDPINILTLLSILTCDDHIKEPLDINMFIQQFCSSKKNHYTWIDEIANLIHYYTNIAPELIEKFNFDYVWVLDDFLRISVYPLNKTDENYLFEGNFVRLYYRLANLLNEIQNICKDTKNHDLLIKINKCTTLLHKDWLRPNSIYLQIHRLQL